MKRHFKRLLEESLKSAVICENNKNWLDKVWTFILKNFSSLSEFADLQLIQYGTNSYSLNYAKSKAPLKFLFVDNQHNLNEHVVEFLQVKCHFNTPNVIGCILFNDQQLSPGLRKHPEFDKYFSYLRLNSLLDAFVLLYECLSLNKIDLKKYVEDNMNLKCKIAIVDHLNSIKLEDFTKNPQFLTIAKDKLPIFRVFNTNEYITAQESEYFRVDAIESLRNLPLNPQIKLIDSSGIEKLAANLKLKIYPLTDLLEKSIDCFTQTKDFNKLLRILEWCFLNNFDEKQKLIGKLLLKNIYRNNSNEQNLIKLNSIYDPNDLYAKLFVPIEFQLHADLNKEPFYHIIRPSLKKEIETKYFVDFIARMENILNKKEFSVKIKEIFEYLNQAKLENQNQLIQSSLHLKWLPSSESNFKLYQGAQLWSPACTSLVGRIQPIVDNELVPSNFMQSLKIRSNDNVTFEKVIENLSYLIHNSITNSNEIDAIYSYLDKTFRDKPMTTNILCEKFVNKNIGFVYDGNSRFCLPNEVILNSELPGLEPFYSTLNNNIFVKKFREHLYLKCFGVKEELDLECVLDLLEKISKDVTNKKMSQLKKTILVASIFKFVENKYLEELAKSKELRSRLLLPVISDSNKGIEFEKPENCVYLIEADDHESSDTVEDYKLESCKEKGKISEF